MHLEIIDWLIIAAFLTVSLFIGLYFKNKAGRSISDFFLGGRNLPWYIAGISMVATTFAADTPLAVTELVGKHGISGNWLWWNMLTGGMLTTFFFARLWRRSGVLTEIELIELRYSGPEAAFLRGFKSIYLGLFMNCLIIGWVNIALMSILKVFFDIPDEQLIWYAFAAMLVTAGYASMSGLLGVVFTDAVQFLFAMAGTIILAVIVVNSEKIGGIEGMKEKLSGMPWALDFFPSIGESASGNAAALSIGIGSFLAFIGVQWWASWYPGAEPGGGGYIAQRMMSTRKEKDALFATLFFQFAHYCLRPWPWIIVGLCALILYPDLSETDKKLGYVMAMKEFLPAGLKGLLFAAFLAAYMSTISTQLNWGASYLVNDFYNRFIGKNDSQEKLIRVSRLVTVLIMFVALFITSLIETISGVWVFIIECGAGLGLVLILRWYWWRINAWSEITATIAPFVAYAVSRFVFDLKFPDSFFITVSFTIITFLTATFITKPVSAERLNEFYRKVKPDGWWKPVAERTAVNAARTNLLNLAVCWISSVALIYSLLFLSGVIILRQWDKLPLWSVTALVSFIILRMFVSKTRVFADEMN